MLAGLKKMLTFAPANRDRGYDANEKIVLFRK